MRSFLYDLMERKSAKFLIEKTHDQNLKFMRKHLHAKRRNWLDRKLFVTKYKSLENIRQKKSGTEK